MITLPCRLFLQTLSPYAELPHCLISSSPAAVAAFPGSDIRAFIGLFTIGYLHWPLKSHQSFEYQFKLWAAYSVTNYDLKVTKLIILLNLYFVQVKVQH